MTRLQLSPDQNQQFRLLLRVCKRTFVAIPGYGNPLVADIVPLHHQSPSLLTALFAIAAQVHVFQQTGRETALLHPYQRALRDTQNALQQPATSTIAAVAGAVLLVLLSIAGPHDDWQHHVSHLVHLIDSSDVETLKSSRTGLFLTMLAAHKDIAVFALGRSTASSGAWMRWDLKSTFEIAGGDFLPHEITTGYPASLISIISELDACATACAAILHPSSIFTSSQGFMQERDRLSQVLRDWKPCHPPYTMPEHPRLALRIARRTMHRAAMLYHARVYGFHANLLNPPSAEIDILHVIEDILFAIRHLLDYGKSHAIPTANAMAWPLAVAGSECGSQTTQYLQAEVLSLIDQLAVSFSMSHLRNLDTVFQTLWQRQQIYEIEGGDKHLSLESVARDHELTILLL